MGNCLKGSRADDISLLPEAGEREYSSTSNPASSHLNLNLGQERSILHSPVSSYHLKPNLSEEEQIKIAKRIVLINHLPIGTFGGSGSSSASAESKECVICMIEFVTGDQIRYLPCLHIYHARCIDDWLIRSLCCPSCMEPVDAALLVSYDQD
ncbi:RNF11 family protein [Megaselia abdita]